MRACSASRLRRRSLAVAALLAWLVSGDAANSSLCAFDRQLLAGSANCPPSACDAEATAACVAYRNTSDVTNVCAQSDASPTIPGCPLKEVDSCLFKCLRWAETPQMDAFTLFLTPNASTNASDLTQYALRQSERFVQLIGAMDMPSRINFVSIVGGSSESSTTSASVVDVRVALSLSGDNVVNLTLANLNMATQLSPSIQVAQSPPNLQSLSVVNSQLTTLPLDITTLEALTTLNLTQNGFVEFSKTYGTESLRHLSLSDNNLTAFEASYPALETLDLSGNQLDAIPLNIFLFSNLTSLDISRNPLESAVVTLTQYEFLTNLSSLAIDGFTADVACDEANKKLLKAIVVCVQDSKELVVLTKSSLTRYIILPIVATAAIALAAFSLWHYRRKRRTAKLDLTVQSDPKTASLGDDSDHQHHFMALPATRSNQGDSGSRGESSTDKVLSTSLWSDEELLACQLRFEDIDNVRQIGVGAFGVVWLVSYRQSRLLASKRLLRDQLTRAKTMAFVAEIKLAARLDHPSIVQFVGVAWTVESDLQALFEYMPTGDLRSFLDRTRDDEEQTGWTRTKLQMAIDMVEALVYVHSFVPSLVHRDFKSKNVLLGDDLQAKLSDFGASRFQSENQTMTTGVGTGKWLAPEVLAGGNDYDHMCDIYSLGIVLSELDTHAMPYEELQQADVATLQLVMTGGVKPRFSADCPDEIRDLADKCLSFEPRNRPSAMEIAFTLRRFAKSCEQAASG